jgi:hypothetical protein
VHEHLERGEPSASETPSPVAPGAESPHALSAAGLLAIQRTAGNRAATAMVARVPRPPMSTRMIQRGAWDAIARGGEMYLGMTDEGAPFARELMRHRLTGLGGAFWKRPTDSDWNDFMLARPEIQRALEPVLKDIAKDMASKGPSGNEWLGGYHDFSKDITGVRLNELESMRLTLHGCHRIEIRGRAHVADDGSDRVVRLYPKMTWIDVADLHPGTVTELEGGATVDDREFTAAGWDYDIHIEFSTQRASTYRVSGGTVTHERGWPPIAGAPAAGFRG